jgi:hypothetical protein
MDNRNIQQNFVELKKPWKERAGETEQEDEAGGRSRAMDKDRGNPA